MPSFLTNPTLVDKIPIQRVPEASLLLVTVARRLPTSTARDPMSHATADGEKE